VSAPTTEPPVAVVPDEPGAPAAQAERAARDRRRFLVLLGVILVIAFAIRMAFILIRQSKAPLGGDAYWYHFQAQLVADGRGFLHPYEYFRNGRVLPGADHPPGMTVILAVLDLLGFDTPQQQRAWMAVMGTGSVALIGFTGRRIGGMAVGLVAAFLAAVYPNIWINDGMLMAETPFIFGIALFLLCAYRWIEAKGWWDVVGMSAGVTLAAMTRPEAVVLFVFLITPMLLARKDVGWKPRIGQLAVAALVPLVLFTPWVAYNLSRFTNPVYLSTGAGQTLVVGNCPLTYSGPGLGYWDRLCLEPPYLDPPDETDLSIRDGIYQDIAFTYIRENLAQQPKVITARILRLWGLFRIDESIGLDGYVEGRAGGEPGTGLGLAREALWAYYVLIGLALPGFVILRRRGVRIYPLVAQFAMGTFVAAISFGITRYRAAAEVAIVLLAAVTLVWLWRKLFGHDPAPEPDPQSDEDGAGSADGAAPVPAAPSS
jgi:4-amino-4-deoxy-L-arabinose transferase-like glycosyltransferase